MKKEKPPAHPLGDFLTIILIENINDFNEPYSKHLPFDISPKIFKKRHPLVAASSPSSCFNLHSISKDLSAAPLMNYPASIKGAVQQFPESAVLPHPLQKFKSSRLLKPFAQDSSDQVINFSEELNSLFQTDEKSQAEEEGWRSHYKPLSTSEIPEHLKSFVADCGLVLA